MILCRECGNSAPSRDGFCSSCGALLDWSGERVETQVLPTVQGAPSGQTVPPIPATAGAGAGPVRFGGVTPAAVSRDGWNSDCGGGLWHHVMQVLP